MDKRREQQDHGTENRDRQRIEKGGFTIQEEQAEKMERRRIRAEMA